MKKLIIFDLDGTIAETKSTMSLDMAELLEELLKKYSVAIMSGGTYKQFESQFLNSLPLLDSLLEKLYLFPTCATSFYQYINKNWTQIYAEKLDPDQKSKITDAFMKCFTEVNFVYPKHLEYGEILEDRDTQITFSALGQNAPLHLKKKWDPYHLKRLSMIDVLKRYIPEFEIRTGGSTSVDVTKKDIDKAYGIKQIEKFLGFKIEEMIFVGDQIVPHGNDFPVVKTGVDYIKTDGPSETAKIIKEMLSGKFIPSIIEK
jgi:hypothetical protein